MPTIITRGAGSAQGFGYAGGIITANFTITAGTGYAIDAVGIGYNYGDAFYYGAFGSCTPVFPSSFAGAKFRAAFDQSSPPYPSSGFEIDIDGFTSAPGQGWFKSVTINGITFLTSNASYYGYNFDGGGTGNTSWGWSTPTTGAGLVSGNTYTVILKK
jgi:hypothetical protein